MAKIRYLEGDTAGTVGYMSYPEIQEALKANPGALEILDGNIENDDQALREEGSLADNAERAEVRRSPVAALDLHEEADPTVVTTEGHGVTGADALRIGRSVTHTAEALPVTSAGPKSQDGVDPLQETRESSQRVVDRQNESVDKSRQHAERAAEAAEENRRAAMPEKGSKGKK